MNVWTVSSRNDTVNGSDHFVVGSYTSRGRALDKCAKFVFDRLAHWDGFAYSMAHDENHPEVAKFFSERRTDGITVLRRDCTKELWNYVRGVLGQDGAYCVFDCTNSWYFDIDENNVEGELWHTVTWCDGDCEDPELTTPRPEAFTSRESAIKSFYHYAYDQKLNRGMPISEEGFRSFVYDTLRKQGKCQVDLGEGRRVSCVLYHDDAKNIRE